MARQAIDQHLPLAAIRGELYRLIAELLAYPSANLITSISRGDLDRQILALLSSLPYELQWQGSSCTVGACAVLPSEYLRVFELPSSQQPCALYGGVHAGDRQATMAELLRFYRHFGLSTSGAGSEDVPDSLPTVLEFLYFLCSKESLVETEAGLGLRKAQYDLLDRHLRAWLHLMLEKLKLLEAPLFYLHLFELLAQFIAAEHAALGEEVSVR